MFDHLFSKIHDWERAFIFAVMAYSEVTLQGTLCALISVKIRKLKVCRKIQSILHLYCSIYREMPERKYTKAILKGFGPLLLPIQLLCTRDA